MRPGAISSACLQELIGRTNPQPGFWLKEAGSISTSTMAAAIRTTPDRFFPLPTTPRRMLSCLPGNSRKIGAGTDCPFSLPMTGDRKLPECESAVSFYSRAGEYLCPVKQCAPLPISATHSTRRPMAGYERLGTPGDQGPTRPSPPAEQLERESGFPAAPACARGAPPRCVR
ncbi:MAG: hypothetical protein JWP25_5068 [Bradyrhizobium sp.]|nr:hypothetical protein [Bradyrhizobium sp.]